MIDRDPYVNLAAAVIQSVANDYITALRKDNHTVINDCERWFHSNAFRVYSLGVKPDVIMKRLQKIAKGGGRHE